MQPLNNRNKRMYACIIYKLTSMRRFIMLDLFHLNKKNRFHLFLFFYVLRNLYYHNIEISAKNRIRNIAV